MKHLSLRVRVFAQVALALVLATGLASAQAGRSTIRGEVTDPQGKLIPGATVTLKSPSIGFSRTQVTTSAGVFGFELIPPGEYQIEVEAPGFKKFVTSARALVGSATDVVVKMEVGPVTETVQVEAGPAAVAINTQDGTLGNNFVYHQITQLPLEARNITSLLTLQPGVTRDGYVVGARADQSNITLDGVDINDQQIEQTIAGQRVVNPLNTPVLRLNSEAIEEFRVTTLTPNANQGRSSAAQVNLLTKSGTNDFHGSLFDAFRNTNWNANNFFNNRLGLPREQLQRNTFGAAAGGPIKKDKLFFFFSYEGRRDAASQTVVRVVPLPSMGLGQMRLRAQHCDDPSKPATCGPVQLVTLTSSQLTNNVWPNVGINPAAVAAFADAAKRYPANDNTQGDQLNTGGFRFNASTPANLNSHVAKFDWNISKNQTAFIRFNDIYDHTGLQPQFPDTPAPVLWSHPWGLVASHTWTIGRSWVNNFRYGYTRQAFSQLGDSSTNNINFRFVFSPLSFSRTLARTTPVHNIVNDTSWVKGNHTVQFGTNLRIIHNARGTFSNAFDTGTTNPSGYQQGGNVVSDPVANYLASSQNLNVLLTTPEAQNAGTALIGRFSQYTARFTFNHDGSLLPSGSPSNRIFATEQFDFYLQDAWKVRRNVTLSLGLRYGVGRPVYETQGFEVKPNVPLSTYFDRRVFNAAQGNPYNQPLMLELSGPVNHRSPMYPWDFSNIQPRAAIAWQPRFESSWLRRIFSGESKSVIRAGFAMTNDYYGEALATFFDLNNLLGFASSQQIPVNTYNVCSSGPGTSQCKPAPLFTGFNQDIRSLPKISVPAGVSFPRLQPVDMGERIESSLDENVHAPREYTFSLTFERQLPAGLTVQASYATRLGRNLLAQRDAMAMNNLVDPTSKMDWYTAATMLEKIRATRPSANTAVTPIPYFENIFPANLTAVMNNFYGCNCIPSTFTPTQAVFWIARNFYGNDWTDLQADIDSARFALGQNTLFMQPQYGALTAWSTIGNSAFSGLLLSVRQRFRSLTWDFNYTYAHSLDDASGLQNGVAYDGAAFIQNPIRQRDWYGNSDFDIRHNININGIYQLPFGRGHWIAGGAGRALDALIGGWQLSGIFRWNTGLPLSTPFDDARWATNWNVQSSTTLTRALSPCITKGDATTAPKLFGCDPTSAYQSFRNAFPGESGQRNFFRLPGYVNLDMGMGKAFTMPWSERQKLQLRWEVFNVTNTQRFGAMDLTRTGFGLRLDPAVRNLKPPSNWSNFTGIQGTPRIMQIGVRFEF